MTGRIDSSRTVDCADGIDDRELWREGFALLDGLDSISSPPERECSMRILLCSLVACFVATNSMNAFAQDKSPFEYENGAKPKKHSRVQPRVGLPPETVAKLIQQRAMRAAENRRARIESRNWAGVSLLRPHLRADLPPLVNSRAGWWWGTASARMQAFWSR